MNETWELDDRAFQAGLAAEAKKMQGRAEQDLQRVGDKAANVARTLVPVDTGRLRDSIEAKSAQGEQGFEVEITSDVEYAASVEFGTSTRSAKPFLRPAVAQASAEFGR